MGSPRSPSGARGNASEARWCSLTVRAGGSLRLVGPGFLPRSPNGFPTACEAVWHLADAGLLYLVADDERAGNALVTRIVEDLDAWIARLKRDGIAHGEIEDLTDGVRKTTILDPDGNSIILGQTPASGD
jgi:hypothetical protein